MGGITCIDGRIQDSPNAQLLGGWRDVWSKIGDYDDEGGIFAVPKYLGTRMFLTIPLRGPDVLIRPWMLKWFSMASTHR